MTVSNDHPLRLGIILETVRQDEVSTPARVQQLVYLMQEARRIPTGYRFKIRHGQPHSEDLETGLSLLTNWKFLSLGYEDENTLPIMAISRDLRPDPEVREALAEWLGAAAPHLRTVRQTAGQFRKGENPREPALTAAIHFLRALMLKRDPGITLEQVTGELARMWPRVSQESIRQRCREMVQDGWLLQEE